jgi:LYR motif-containing protein 4
MSALNVYRGLLRAGRQFNNYNTREYVQRRTRDEFRKYRDVTDKHQAEQLLQRAQNELNVIARQVVVDNLYNHNKIELVE